jgi:autotransporter-associated beta strand protein
MSGAPTFGVLVNGLPPTISLVEDADSVILDFNNPYGEVSSASFNAIAHIRFSENVALQNAYIVLNGSVATLAGNINWIQNKWYFNVYNGTPAAILFKDGTYATDYADRFVLPNTTIFTVEEGVEVTLGGEISGGFPLVIAGGGQINFTSSDNTFDGLEIGDAFSVATVGVEGSSSLAATRSDLIGASPVLLQGPLGIGNVILQDGSSLIAQGTSVIENAIASIPKSKETVYIGALAGTFTLSGEKIFSGAVAINQGLTGEVYLQGINDIANLDLQGGILRLGYLGSHTYKTLSINDASAVLTFDGAMNLGTSKSILALDACVSSEGSCVADAANVIDDGGYEIAILSKIVGGSFSTLVKKGVGVLTLENIANTYAGGTDIQEGAIALLGGSNRNIIQTLGTGVVTLEENARLIAREGGILANVIQTVSPTTLAYLNILQGQTLTLSNALVVSGDIGVGEGLIVNDLVNHTGTLSLLGSNDISALRLVKGELLLSEGASFTVGSAIYLEGGSLGLGSAAYTLANMVIHLEAESNIITDFGYEVAISSLITGDGAFLKEGLGVTTLLSNNTFTGGVQIVEGVLAMDTLEKINFGDLTLVDGFLQLTATDTLPSSANVIIYGGGFDLTPSTILTIDAVVSGDGDFSVSGGGKLILTANNLFTGSLLIDGAEVSIAEAGNLGVAAAIALADGSLDITQTLSLERDLIIQSGLGTLDITPGEILTLTGVVSGIESGTLLVNGGTLILAANNSFAGVINAVDSVVQVVESANLGTGTKALLLNNATLSIPGGGIWSSAKSFSVQEQAVVTTAGGVEALFTGAVTMTPDTAIVIKDGVGRFSLLPTIASNYIPYLIIEEGEFAGNSLVLLASKVDISAGAALIFSQTGVGSYIGNAVESIIGEGKVVIEGPGKLIFLADNNTYSGGTELISGILQIEKDVLGLSTAPLLGLGGTLSTVKSFITSRPIILAEATETILAPIAGTVLTWAGDISGDGALVKDNAGKLILSGDNTYLGKTYVLGGELSVLSNIVSSGDPYVATGALLEGTGSVGDSIVFGTIAGGDPLGTLTIVGDLVMQQGSFLGSFLTPLESSFIEVTNDISIGENVTYLAGFAAKAATHRGSITVLSGANISGGFSKIATPAIFFLGGDLTYTETEISYAYDLRSIASLAGKGNTKNVASSLDHVVNWNREHVTCTIAPAGFNCSSNERLPRVLESLIGFTTKEQMTKALAQLQPSSLMGLTILQEHNGVEVRGALNQRFQQEIDSVFCFKKDSAQPCVKDKKLVGVWGYGIGDVLFQGNTEDNFGSQIGYIGKMAGVVSGVDFYFLNSFYVGALGGYTVSNLHWKQEGGSGRVNTGYLGVYTSFMTKRFYATAAVIGGSSGYRVNRRIHYPGVDKTAKSHHGGQQLLSHLDIGANFPFSGFTIRPFNSFDYVAQTERGFQETQSGEWDLFVKKNSSILLRNELGLQFPTCFCCKASKLSITPKISWVREVRIKGGSLTASLNGSNTFFTVTGYFPDRNLLSPGLILTGSAFQDRLSVSLYYDAELRNGYSAQSFGGGARFSF